MTDPNSDWPREIKNAVNAFESDLEWDILAAVIDGPQTHDELIHLLDTNTDALDTAVSNLQKGALVSRRNTTDLTDKTAYRVELSEYGSRFTHAMFDTLGSVESVPETVTKDDLDGDTNFWVVADVEQGVGITVHPDFMPEDETLEEHLERSLKEDYIGRLAAEIADGIRSGQVSLNRIERD